MGFESEAAKHALQLSRNDLAGALDIMHNDAPCTDDGSSRFFFIVLVFLTCGFFKLNRYSGVEATYTEIGSQHTMLKVKSIFLNKKTSLAPRY